MQIEERIAKDIARAQKQTLAVRNSFFGILFIF